MAPPWVSGGASATKRFAARVAPFPVDDFGY
jgi:hypothetical protein